MLINTHHKLTGFAGILLALSIGGCAPIKQSRDVTTSGFLGDYSPLKPGKDGEALKIYINPRYQQSCKTYDKVLIEPVGIWIGENSDMASLPATERQNLVNHLHGSLVSEMGKYYQIVTKPQPGTLRIKAAITEAEGSWVPLDTVSSFVPQMLVLSKLKELTTGTAAFVGKASGEVAIDDAETGERIAAAVDRMVGAKSSIGVTNKWDDVNRSFDYWSERMAYRLANCGAMPQSQNNMQTD